MANTATAGCMARGEVPIRVCEAPNGALTYAIATPPECLPAVPPGQLLAAWAMARRAAALERWGPLRQMVFHREGAPPTELVIADADAGCWAEAVDSEVGLDTLPGLALCLRLLALIEVLTRARWASGMFDITPDGIDLHPALLRAAASMPLDASARFDEPGLRRLLSRPLPRPSPVAGRPVPRPNA
jgi:hypothetical protein